MNPLADELNTTLDQTAAGRLLSALGHRLYFPKGIIAQTAEAKKTAQINATIGMACDKGRPLVLSAVAEQLPGFTPEETVAYAPTAGLETLRAAWKEALLRKNPSLKGKTFSLPAVVPGITAGISYAADLFLDEGQTILAANPCWDNYELIFAGRRNSIFKAVPLFAPGGTGLDLAALQTAVDTSAASGAVRVILNFPNNPSGYTPSRAEAAAVAAMLENAARGGADVLALCDDAYFGLFYGEETTTESLFSTLAGLHERLLAVKIDGPTKEDYVWGFRAAFVTFAAKGMEEAHYSALEKKLMGTIRSSVSCSNTLSQNLTLRAMAGARTEADRKRYYTLLRNRYLAVKRFLADNPCPPALEALPFNSGYFMSFRCTGISAETLRKKLLERGVGTIALGDAYLRVTFAAVEESDIPAVYRAIYEAAESR
jgi:aspartate/methionine/tyrosine aminotransferase